MNAPSESTVFDEISVPIGGVPHDKIMSVWEKVEPLLERVVKRDTGMTLDSVLNELQTGQWQLWVVGNFQGVIVTYIEVRPLEKVLFTRFLAGDDMAQWLDDWVKVQEAYAKNLGCAAVVFFGRKGWQKWQKHYRDYKSITTEYRKEL